MTNQKPYAKRSLGQNFLIDQNFQNKILRSIKNVYKNQTIVEIGPGRGAITQHLKDFAKKLILIEKDSDFAEKFRLEFQNQSRIQIHEGDVLDIDFATLLSNETDVIVIGNLPYNISSQILVKLFENNSHFSFLFLMFQKEVGERCLAKFGSKDYGSLAVWTQVFSQGEKLFDVPPNAFKPRPNVMSSFLKFKVLQKNFQKEKKFLEFSRKAFLHRRKMIRSKFKDVIKNKNLESDLFAKRTEDLDLMALRELFDLLGD